MTAARIPEPSPRDGELDRLRLKLERTQLQVEVSNVVVSKLTLKDLLVAVSDLLKRFINHDFASVVLYNPESQQLRIHALDAPPPDNVLGEGEILPLEGTPPGLAIVTQKTVRRDLIDLEEFHSPIMKAGFAAGLRSGCSVPLISHGRVLGTINVGCMREVGVSDEDQELLEQISSQVAIAVENALNFERAERERQRTQLLLDINNAVVSHLDLRELIRVIATCLRNVIQPDVTGISLYDPETNQFRAYTFFLYRRSKRAHPCRLKELWAAWRSLLVALFL